MTEDFYDLLEIPPDASQDEIKDAYREQVRVYHPDLNDDDRAQAQFTAVQTAYDILGDPVERQAYDRLGHEDYVAKRTSGLPSPDVWKTDDGDEADGDSSGTELSYSESETASASASTSSRATGSTASGATTGGRSSSTGGSSGTASTAGAASATAGAASGASSATGTATGSGTGSGSGTADSGSGTSRRTGGANAGTGRSRRTETGSDTNGGAGNPLVRWWRRRNVSLPLIWLSILVYAAGLGHFGLENRVALGSLWADLRSIGADPSGIWTLLSEGRHGLETTVAFVRRVEVVAPPLERPLWYGALAGVVALAVVGLLVDRVVRREETRGQVTIDETIVVALTVGAATTLVGGPLLAGAVLMPLLFGVIIRRTRRGPGWTPSYGYVLPVLAPLVGFGAVAAGYATLPVDLVAFVILPLMGGLGLPLRTIVRTHFDR